VNKYGKVTVDKESYALPGACIGETILAKLWWDKIEMLDQNQVPGHLSSAVYIKTQTH